LNESTGHVYDVTAQQVRNAIEDVGLMDDLTELMEKTTKRFNR
jgi:hypothetical protein